MASVQYSTVNVLFPHQNFLNNILFSLAYFTVRIQYIIHIHKISVNKWFMLPTRLLVNSNLQLSFGELKSYTRIFNCVGVIGISNLCVIQGTTVRLSVPFYICENSGLQRLSNLTTVTHTVREEMGLNSSLSECLFSTVCKIK